MNIDIANPMTNEQTVEMVALALANQQRHRYGFPPCKWTDLSPGDHSHYIDGSKAAIAVLATIPNHEAELVQLLKQVADCIESAVCASQLAAIEGNAEANRLAAAIRSAIKKYTEVSDEK